MESWRSRIREGMTVVSADGKKVGKITSFDADGFTIEKGIYFPRDHLARYGDVARVEGDDVHLAVERDALLPLEDRMKLEERGEWAPRGDGAASEVGSVRPKETIRVEALQEEEVDAGARRSASGLGPADEDDKRRT